MEKHLTVSLYFILFMSLILVACQTAKSQAVPFDENMETIVISGSYNKYEEEEDLFNAADLVVIAETNLSFEDRKHVIEYMPSYHDNLDQAIEDYYTKTPITISKVLKSSASEQLKKNKKLTIIEPLSLIHFDDGSIQKLVSEDYVELEEHNKYILYLTENTYGEYTILNAFNGRFNLEKKEQMIYSKHKQEEMESQKEQEDIEEIYEQIKEQAKGRLEKQ
ncbi:MULTISPECIES: hypothetical protein [Bacillaceae]|uniref:Uncharacterized protein n=1 Tax=Evansella alkalicola TaxID=745819 RepID=A0ABS6JSZ1_9BACI|nr:MULTISPECIES: hypothetical protein [Bacillaceae]MBU9721540.1 hypothetical protein [Bacillus alkalicola]